MAAAPAADAPVATAAVRVLGKTLRAALLCATLKVVDARRLQALSRAVPQPSVGDLEPAQAELLARSQCYLPPWQLELCQQQRGARASPGELLGRSRGSSDGFLAFTALHPAWLSQSPKATHHTTCRSPGPSAPR